MLRCHPGILTYHTIFASMATLQIEIGLRLEILKYEIVLNKSCKFFFKPKVSICLLYTCIVNLNYHVKHLHKLSFKASHFKYNYFMYLYCKKHLYLITLIWKNWHETISGFTKKIKQTEGKETSTSKVVQFHPAFYVKCLMKEVKWKF